MREREREREKEKENTCVCRFACGYMHVHMCWAHLMLMFVV